MTTPIAQPGSTPKPTVTAVIPSRLAATRLPEKPLADIKGKPMIQHVWERAKKARGVDRVVVATDHPRIMEAVQRFGGEAVMTSPELPSGTDRIGAVAKAVASGPGSRDEDIYINVQGDEPMLDPAAIEAALALVTSGRFAFSTAAAPFGDAALLKNPNAVKVLIDAQDRAIYFSRYPIPYSRVDVPTQPGPSVIPLHHMGLYVYTRATLLEFCRLARTDLEVAESLEQLRALHNGIPIGVARAAHASIGVDTAEDLELIRKLM